jgi:hypothetical protein
MSAKWSGISSSPNRADGSAKNLRHAEFAVLEPSGTGRGFCGSDGVSSVLVVAPAGVVAVSRCSAITDRDVRGGIERKRSASIANELLTFIKVLSSRTRLRTHCIPLNDSGMTRKKKSNGTSGTGINGSAHLSESEPQQLKAVVRKLADSQLRISETLFDHHFEFVGILQAVPFFAERLDPAYRLLRTEYAVN